MLSITFLWTHSHLTCGRCWSEYSQTHLKIGKKKSCEWSKDQHEQASRKLLKKTFCNHKTGNKTNISKTKSNQSWDEEKKKQKRSWKKLIKFYDEFLFLKQFETEFTWKLFLITKKNLLSILLFNWLYKNIQQVVSHFISSFHFL